MKTSTWKRTAVGAGLALALPFGLAACGDDEGTDVENNIEEQDDAPTRGGGDTDDLEDDDMEDEEDDG